MKGDQILTNVHDNGEKEIFLKLKRSALSDGYAKAEWDWRNET